MPAPCGFKIHEDYGAYPELIDARPALRRRPRRDRRLHTDGLHEAAELEDTVAAIAGRTVHAYHVEGTRRRPRAGPARPRPRGRTSSARRRRRRSRSGSTRPPSSVPMTVLNHGASFGVPGDVALVRERVHPRRWPPRGRSTSSARSQIVNSDSQGMGRIEETFRRTHPARPRDEGVARDRSRSTGHPGLPGRRPDDRRRHARVLRYLAKVTIEPAITHGVAEPRRLAAPGRLADIVLWKPAYFGVKPELVLKGGFAAWAPLGEGNATVDAPNRTPRAIRTRERSKMHITATLVIGIGLGRFSTTTKHDATPATQTVAAIGSVAPVRSDTSFDAPYNVEASQYLGQTAALLIALPSETRSGHPDDKFVGRGGGSADATRLLLDSPAANDNQMRALLEDLELVLAQVVRLQNGQNGRSHRAGSHQPRARTARRHSATAHGRR